MEEICTLSAGRWGIVVSEVEPGTLEHRQGSRHAVTMYCDNRPIAVCAYNARRCGEGACVEETSGEEPDLVDFVLSDRDLQGLEFLLGRAHQLLRHLSKSARGQGSENSEVRWNDRDRRKPNSSSHGSTTTP